MKRTRVVAGRCDRVIADPVAVGTGSQFKCRFDDAFTACVLNGAGEGLHNVIKPGAGDINSVANLADLKIVLDQAHF